MKHYPPPPYSPGLVKLRQIHQHLRQVIQRLAHPNEDWEQVMEEHSRKLELLDVAVPNALADCRAFLKEHTKTLRATEATELRKAPGRKQFQEELIKQCTDGGNGEAAKIIRRMQ